ncbi:hypothetical protein PSTG_06144 [Puccinia striiformis f. sp. tritici PST-78]|uniref:Uncharacterized protein n=1 Tax=Puccinia striiformis f. sp. tritici PST-78 TaxID=1165861 RepID=A0A0L0VNX0_9BASI|nr:hypothetical protein PSTG_06144 [Puccinia striiformis f. sp. tritici PST-78]
MGLQRCQEDIENFDEGEGADLLEECIKQIHLTPEGSHVGYRKIRHLLCTKYGINIHLRTAARLNRSLDPEGVVRQSKRVLKRCVFDVEGPNFIWPADGHDKLKKFGLTIYGFIDAWSCKDGLNKWLTNYNSFKRRYDPKRMLPTGCSANVCYKNPEEYDGEEGLIPVDLSCVDELEHEHYPDAEDLMRTSPGWFSEIMDRLKTEMESDHLFPNWGDDYSALLVAVGSSDWSLVA